MAPERWKDILGNVKDKFKVEDEGSFHDEEEGGVDVEFIIFAGPLGRMRLEYSVKPAVIDKKVSFSNRIGSRSEVKYVYSDTEKVQKMKAYKWDDNDENWVEMEAKKFDL
ncbi:MAG: hypothetical protein WC745_02860 [Patescibacteria group bacterium]|jgi:hypothetical protein